MLLDTYRQKGLCASNLKGMGCSTPGAEAANTGPVTRPAQAAGHSSYPACGQRAEAVRHTGRAAGLRGPTPPTLGLRPSDGSNPRPRASFHSTHPYVFLPHTLGTQSGLPGRGVPVGAHRPLLTRHRAAAMSRPLRQPGTSSPHGVCACALPPVPFGQWGADRAAAAPPL